MTSRLIFLDTETTGLSLNDDIWEFAAIIRDPGQPDRTVHTFVKHDVTKVYRLPFQYQADRWARYDDDAAVFPDDLATLVLDTFGDERPHVVGANPSFDTTRLELLLNQRGKRAPWHHHLIDVEAMMFGYLVGEGMNVPIPWRPEDLAALCGVPPQPQYLRHRALGDAEWVRSIYDTLTGRGACQAPHKDECTDQTPCASCGVSSR